MIGFNHAIELREKEAGIPYLIAAAKFPESPDYVKTWSSTILRRIGKDKQAFSLVQEQFTIETLRANLKLTKNEKLKEELSNRIVHFYKKAGKENASHQDVVEYEAKLRRLYMDYFQNFPFLELEFYGLLFLDEGESSSGKRADADYIKAIGLRAF
jgi:hypothetical protein